MSDTIKAADGEFDIELHIVNEATATAIATHRDTGKKYGFKVGPPPLAVDRVTVDLEQASGDDSLFADARTAMLRVARANRMLVNDSALTPFLAVGTKGAGFNQSVFGFAGAGFDRAPFDTVPFDQEPEAPDATIEPQTFINESRVYSPTVSQTTPERSYDPLRTKHTTVLSLALSLETIAREKIEELSDINLNNPVSIDDNKKQIDLLIIFAEGLSQIAAALDALGSDPNQPVLLGKAREIVDGLASQLQAWWENNGQEAVDWAFRIPIMTAGIAMLDLAGAYMPVATTAMAAIVGGSRVLKALRTTGKSPVTSRRSGD